jgi:dipeptidyl-peptidase-4
MRKQLTTLVWILGSLTALQAQKTFTAEELLRGRMPQGFYGFMPTVVEWQGDDKLVLNTKIHPDSATKPWVMDVKSGKLTPHIAGRAATEPQVTVSLKNKDLYWRKGNEEKRLTNDTLEEKNPTLSPDKSKVAFTRANNLYCIDLATGKEVQLTTDGTQTILNGYATWVYWEEIFGRGTRFRAFWWSPDNKTIAFMRFDENRIPMFPLYVADGTHGYIEETRYPKAGDPNPEVKLGFVQADGGPITWIDFGVPDSHQLGWPKWNPTGDRLYVQWQNRGQDTLRMFAINPADGSRKEVYTETQKTWIDLSEADGRLEFINGGKDMLIQSDKTGWHHLYLYSADGTFKNAITSGNYRVTSVDRVDEKAGMVYFRARTLERSAENNLFRVRMNGKDLVQLTPSGENVIDVNISPTGRYMVVTHNNVSKPSTITLFDAAGKPVRTLGSMADGKIKEYSLAKTELIRIKSADGKYDLPAVVTWPTNMQPGKKYPMLVSIYGGPDAGTVYDRWQWSPLREFYAQEGLIQVAFDHRASGHFGKEGVNWMYRNLGHWELEDYSTMAKWFINKGYADETKIAITGFSYGGYITCLALTKGADVFTHGMAGGSVTDWRLYDSHYTERFMDTPAENPEGYKLSSVMHYTDRYKGMLQIVHGTLDDNVHMQNSLQLIGALQDKGKDFEFMLYPNGRHGWANLPARNNHFNNLKTKFIYRHLMGKQPPEGLLR